MKEYAFGIDLGGTTAKVGLFTTSGALLEKWEVPTDTSNAGEHILENLADAIHAKMAEKEITSEQVEGVGIGVPGPVLDSRVVPIICANLGGWGERNVSAQLSGLLDGMKVLVGNDANVAALGEIWMGTAKGCRSAVMVTLGTGVGGGVIVNGKVIDGAHGAGGEIGHITVNRHETATCGCGKHGCLEQYSSATGVVRCMKKLLDENPDADCVLRGKDFEAKDVFDAARSGDALAAREVDEMTDTLAWLWPPLPAPPTPRCSSSAAAWPAQATSSSTRWWSTSRPTPSSPAARRPSRLQASATTPVFTVPCGSLSENKREYNKRGTAAGSASFVIFVLFTTYLPRAADSTGGSRRPFSPAARRECQTPRSPLRPAQGFYRSP